VAPRTTRVSWQMANASRRDLSSAFDDMLSKSRKSLDELYRGGSGSSRAASVFRTSQVSDAGVSRTAAGGATSELGADSIAVRTLNERLGRDWRYEISERKRDGDEAIVLCKLILGKDGASRAQFGRAIISSVAVAGASGGVAFKVSGGDAGSERDAFRRATEAALMNCADII
jgi:hypothetical protein